VRRLKKNSLHLIALAWKQLIVECFVYPDQNLDRDCVETFKGLLSVRNRYFTLLYGAMLMLGMAGSTVAQNNPAQQPSARQQLQHLHTPQSIDQELAHLAKDLELTPEQQQQVRPLLQAHHDKIQALLDKSPDASRQELGPQIHAISDETHHEIHALLTDHQKDLETAMLQRENNGAENRRSAQPAIP